MIRSKSYLEAIKNDCEITRESHENVSYYISTSSEDSDDDVKRSKPQYSKIFKSENMFFSDNFHLERQQYEAKDRSQSEDRVHDPKSWTEIYENCLKYISDNSIKNQQSKKSDDFNSLNKILNEGHESKVPIKVDLAENRTSFHINVDAIPHENNQPHLATVSEEFNYRNPLETITESNKVFPDVYTATEHDDDDENSELRDITMSDEISSFPLHYIGRNSSRKKRKTPENSGNRSRKVKRVIRKNGNINIPLRQNILLKSKLYLDDFATTLIECQWRWLIFWFSAANMFVWVAFALMFYVSAYANGDLDENPVGTLCIADGKTFTGIFTFSVESQVSIGYGEKYPNEECPETTFILMMEVIVGNALIGGMVSVVYAKIIRPRKYLEGVGFSKNALVCMRDGKLCFVIRVWDCLEKHSVGTQIHGWFLKIRDGLNPIVYPIEFEKSPIISWPTTIQHVINEQSPLYDLSAKDLLDKRFEIVITLTGSSKSTGSMSQSKTSYLPHEILWGSIFKEVLSYKDDEKAFVIDKKSLNTVQSIDIPLCSARLLKHFNNAMTGNGISASVPASPTESPKSPLVSPNWSFKVRKFRNNMNTSLP